MPKISKAVYWFKYGLTVFVMCETAHSSLDGQINTDEIQNACLVTGIWVSTPNKKRKINEEDQQREISRRS